MTSPQMQPYQQGSNQGAVKILLVLVLGSMLLGGSWSLLGPGNRLIGTWQIHDGNSLDIFRFDADGSFWYRGTVGIFSAHVVGTYQVLKASGKTYRVRMRTELGDRDREYRFESPDRLVSLDPDNPKDQALFTRTGDWVLANRPSESAATYDGATPHLGCWQRRGTQTPDLELLEGGTLLRYSGDEAERATYSADYSKVPFRLDFTDGEGQVDREIFDFAAGGAMRISRTHLEGGERPKEMDQYQSYFPCPEPDSQGDS